MPATYEPIATTTLGSTNTVISFSSIATSWTDLRIVLVGTGTSGNIYTRFNSDTGTNYSRTYLYGNGTSAATGRDASQTNIPLTLLTNLNNTTPTFRTMDIFSYAGSTFKTCLTTESADLNGSGSVVRLVGLWRSTSAINAISLTASSGVFNIGTTATLYGIKAA